jgi:hypothetical protein
MVLAVGNFKRLEGLGDRENFASGLDWEWLSVIALSGFLFDKRRRSQGRASDFARCRRQKLWQTESQDTMYAMLGKTQQKGHAGITIAGTTMSNDETP